VFALATRLPEGDFLSWGWRIPFLASALLIVVGLVIRFQIDETPEFQKLRESKKTAKMPVLEALTTGSPIPAFEDLIAPRVFLDVY
jgi:MHS family shikimate/dehydroshikimate transporter-like MFS transporter